MSAADVLATIGVYVIVVVCVGVGVLIWDAIKRRDADDVEEQAHYDRARAAKVALDTPVADRSVHPTAHVPPHPRHDRHVTADDMAEVLMVDEWERHLEDGAA